MELIGLSAMVVHNQYWGGQDELQPVEKTIGNHTIFTQEVIVIQFTDKL